MLKRSVSNGGSFVRPRDEDISEGGGVKLKSVQKGISLQTNHHILLHRLQILHLLP